MSRRISAILMTVLVLSLTAGAAYLRVAGPGADMTRAAQAYLNTLSEEQRGIAQMPYDTPERVGWHFIPKAERKGLAIARMDATQRAAAAGLLQAALSDAGYDKATTIMSLERVLHELAGGAGPIRDPDRFYYTVFGNPGNEGKWGLSVEGHHLSLNFVVEDGRVTASTPAFLGANPSIVEHEVEGAPERGTRVLAEEEEQAFALLASLDDSHRREALIAERAPRDIRAAGEAEPPAYEQRGLSYARMNDAQREALKELIGVYAGNLPEEVSAEKLQAIEEAGYEKVHFAWAGADRPGVGHYYLIQGPTFLIEFVNVQPDAAGNPARHIHSVWRDPTGDFAIR